MLLNPGFEGGTWRKTYTGQEFGEIDVPQDWTFWWRIGPALHDPANTDGYGRPEAAVIQKVPPYLDPSRIYEGNQALKFFTFYRIHDAGVFQKIATIPGTTYRLTFRAHAWSSKDNDPRTSEGAPGAFYALAGTVGLSDAQRNFTFMAGVDLDGGVDPFLNSIQWGQGAHIYNAYAAVPALTFTATGTSATILLRSNVLWPYQHNDAYMDAVTLEVETTPVICRGAPREQYERTYHVYYPSATAEQRRALALRCADLQQTFGPSFDDSGIGDLDIRRAICHFVPVARHQEFLAWYATWYPGVVVTFEDTPDEPPESLRLTGPTTHRPVTITKDFDWPDGGHGGVDYASSYAAWGDMVVCAYDGVVVNDTNVLDSKFGYFVLARCQYEGKTFDLRYAHFVEPSPFKKGDTIKRGQHIGKPDSTGYSTGDHLHFSLYMDGDYRDPKPYIDWPTIDPVAPIRPIGASSSTILLHEMQTNPPGIQNFLQSTRPPAHLVVGQGGGPQLAQARAWWPNALLTYRRVENDLDVYSPTQAAGLVQRYISDLAASFDLSDFSKPPFYIASINERGYECGRPDFIAAAAAWDVAFMQAVEATSLNLKAIVYLAPVGNPNVTPADLDPLLPMVARACNGRHVLGKHCYYASVPSDPLFYQYSGMWYQFRFAQDDAYFVSKGYRPYWMLEEGGACMATIYPTVMAALSDVSFDVSGRDWPNKRARVIYDGNKLVDIKPIEDARLADVSFAVADYVVSLNPGAGWRAVGSIQRYRDELLWCHSWYKAWNAANNNRLLGVNLFTTGGWGWDLYDLQGADLDVVTAGLAAVL